MYLGGGSEGEGRMRVLLSLYGLFAQVLVPIGLHAMEDHIGVNDGDLFGLQCGFHVAVFLGYILYNEVHLRE